MKKRIIAIMCVAVVLIICLVVPVGAVGSDEWSQYDWIPDYDFIEGFREFTPYPGYYERHDGADDVIYTIGGSWQINSNPGAVLFDVPSDVPSDVNRFTPFITQYYYEREAAIALTIVNNGQYVSGGIALVLERSPDDFDKAYLVQLQYYDYVRNNVIVIWDYQQGFLDDDYNVLSFGHGAVDPQLSVTAFNLLVESGLISPLTVNYGNNNDGGSTFVDFTTWLATAVGGFFDFSLFGGFTIGHMVGSIVAFSFVMLFLKFFAGG